MDWLDGQDVHDDLQELLGYIDLPYIDLTRVFCYRSKGSKARAYARTWSFPKIFQQALSIKPAYVIEVLAEHYDKLDSEKKRKVLIHELLHIPKNFSGALLPHHTRSRNLNSLATKLYNEYKKQVEKERKNR